MVQGFLSEYFALRDTVRTPSMGQRISHADAVAFMNEIKAAAFLRLDHNADGCIQRSDLIQNLLETKGVQHGFYKICFESGPWLTHFAPYAVLENGEDVVFDVIEFDKPLSKEEWTDYWVQRSGIQQSFYKNPGFLIRSAPEKDIEHLASFEQQLVFATA